METTGQFSLVTKPVLLVVVVYIKLNKIHIHYSRARRTLFATCLVVLAASLAPLSGLLRLLGGRIPLALDGRGRRRGRVEGISGEVAEGREERLSAALTAPDSIRALSSSDCSREERLAKSRGLLELQAASS